MKITTIGVDLAKNVFQVHGIDEAGEVIVRKTLRRRQMRPFFSKLEPPGLRSGPGPAPLGSTLRSCFLILFSFM